MADDILRGGMETLCLEFEAAHKSGKSPRIEQYLERISADGRGGVLLELLLVEFRQLGAMVDLAAYEARFPSYANVIAKAWKILEDQETVDLRTTCSNAKAAGLSVEGALRAAAILPEWIGRYQVLRLLGSGGFGDVYLGQDPNLSRHVAIKVPRHSRILTAADQQKFLEEARKMVEVQGPGIATIYDVFQEQVGGLNTVCIVQQYIEGKNLADWRREQTQPPTPDWVARLVAQISQILAPAHRKGLIHRDLKPANILLSEPTGKPLVLDFGLALHEGQRFQRSGVIEGTLVYMSPEQTRGETHRMDSRTDIWSLGVILYELLTGRRPFSSSRHEELLFAIQHGTPQPPRMLDENIPRELERICLKCLSKSMEDRYTTVTDLAEELLEWRQAQPVAMAGAAAAAAAGLASLNKASEHIELAVSAARSTVVPRGLRPFCEEDGEFFLELLPGVRERNGLPDSISFWKRRIEVNAPKYIVPVGLIFGPSGCGKSSLMLAGLLPRLDRRVTKVYLEASRDSTERQLLGRLRQRFPGMPAHASLQETFASLREGDWLPPDGKLLVVVDQFEQWLYSHQQCVGSELGDALRQCDGQRVQAILLVRDDYWTPTSEFFRTLDVRLAEDKNCQRVNRFERAHARKVLVLFGQAYEALPKCHSQLSPDHEAFLDLAIDALAEDGKVVGVRLTVFVELMKGRAWVPQTIAQMGGVQGVGKAFFEESFASRDASPIRKRHSIAAQRILRTLMPPPGIEIKGHSRTDDELADAAGYAARPLEYAELITILDEELRLITPAYDDERQRIGYQLTHDYLVPSLREWLARKLRETRRGRAEMLLEERAATWQANSANRYLPSLWESGVFALLTRRRNWTPTQRSMMTRAARYHAFRLIFALVLVIAFTALAVRFRQDAISRQKLVRDQGLVDELINAAPARIPTVVAKLATASELAITLLAKTLRTDESSQDARRARLHAQMALVSSDSAHVDSLFEYLLDGELAYVGPIRELLQPYAPKIKAESLKLLQDGGAPARRRFRAAIALAGHDLQEDLASRADWAVAHRDFIAEQLVSSNPDDLPLLRTLLRPISTTLLPELERIFSDTRASDIERLSTANTIVDYARSDTVRLAKLLTLATPSQFEVLYPIIEAQCSAANFEYWKQVAATQPPPVHGSAERVAFGQRRANAAVSLLRLGQLDDALGVFSMNDDPEATTQFVFRCRPRNVDVTTLLECLKTVSDAPRDRYPKATRYGLLLTLGEFKLDEIPAGRRTALLTQLRDWYANDPSSGVHGATGWLLNQWGDSDYVTKIDQTPCPYSPDREWFTIAVRVNRVNQLELLYQAVGKAIPKINPMRDSRQDNNQDRFQINTDPNIFYFTFIVFPAGIYTVGSPDDERARNGSEVRHTVRLTRPFAILNREITQAEVCQLPVISGPGAFDYQLEVNTNRLDPQSAAGAVSWYDAVRFCRWLGTRRGYSESNQPYPDPSSFPSSAWEPSASGSWALRDWPLDLSRGGFRLPTEAEWEIACRGGAITAYAFGGDSELVARFDWCGEDGVGHPHATRQRRPTLRGLHDMHGNVSEWCHDWSEIKKPGTATDPQSARGDGAVRSVRGGTIGFVPINARAACRSSTQPTTRMRVIGFRIAMTLGVQMNEDSNASR